MHVYKTYFYGENLVKRTDFFLNFHGLYYFYLPMLGYGVN